MLVLVVEVTAKIHLAEALRGCMAEDIAEHANFQAPVSRESHLPKKLRIRRELTREWIAAHCEEAQQRRGAKYLAQGLEQREHQQPGHPPVHPAPDAAIIA